MNSFIGDGPFIGVHYICLLYIVAYFFGKMQFNWTFSYIFRQDYVANEVTLDYNAGFQGAVGKLGDDFGAAT